MYLHLHLHIYTFTYMIMALMEDTIFHSFIERLRTMQFRTTPATPMAALRSQAFWRGWSLCWLCSDIILGWSSWASYEYINCEEGSFIFILRPNPFRAVQRLSGHLSLRERNKMSEVEIIRFSISTFILTLCSHQSKSMFLMNLKSKRKGCEGFIIHWKLRVKEKSPEWINQFKWRPDRPHLSHQKTFCMIGSSVEYGQSESFIKTIYLSSFWLRQELKKG